MGMDDTESCSSRAVDSSASQPRQQRHKLDVYNEVLRRLKDGEDARLPGFEDELWAHFNRLPARYAMDVNVERAQDVLMHKRLLQMAVDPANRPAFDVRIVQVLPVHDSLDSDGQEEEDAQSCSVNFIRQSIHPPPVFGSSPNLEALALEASRAQVQDGDSVANANLHLPRPMHEITFSADDRPKLLSQLTSLLAEIGLNIQEAHAFSTNDGYSLDVFVVDGWPYEETEQLKRAIQKEIQKIEKPVPAMSPSFFPFAELRKIGEESAQLDCVQIPTDGTDVWEIDVRQLKVENKIASGSYGDLGVYCSQDVAIKVLKPERLNAEMQREFAQEVYIMRKVRHKNVVQFIGACTRPPSLCIITEFMSGGSLYDFLHKQKGAFKLPALLRVAIDVSKGMNYLHQNNIIHRDLKAANLLMDEHELPYEHLTPLQAAVGVVQKGLRPTIPKSTHPKLAELLDKCWQQDPSLRPDFSEILDILQQITKEISDETNDHRKDKSSGGFLSVLRRGH
ncbi:hypothetical protein Taro_033059 [Colocasia esculenta]|uniref:non-specific serine/threonine protein kinase n=1 Tax=Colocasia esculenta TaxID=4460 RepID=A0A843VSW9_COLES|nr:hypothetical protein [Colocasia esculenta]